MSDVPYTLAVATAPAAEPVSKDDLKSFLRIDHCDEDAILNRAISAAISAVQDRCGVQLITATYDLKFFDFPDCVIELPRVPLQSITSIKCTDDDGTVSTVNSAVYLTDLGSTSSRGYVRLADGRTWPTNSRGLIRGDVAVRFVCGFGDAASDVPDTYIQQVLLLAGHLYRTRSPICCGGGGGTVPMTMDLLDGVNMFHEFR